MGVPFAGLWLTAPPDVLRGRVSAREGDASDADIGVLNQQLARFQKAESGLSPTWQTIDVSGTPAENAATALDTLAKQNVEKAQAGQA